MRLLAVRGLVCAWVACWSGVVSASEPSGTAIAVVQSTQAFGQMGNRILQASGPVYSGDQIVTGPSGQAQVVFRDNTKLVVGPNSRMKIDAFIFGGGGSAKEVSIAAVRGAFRFITGGSPKSAYTITTPTATIGVRGTEFDFNVSRSRLDLAVFSGQTRVCDQRSGTCFLQDGGCSVSQSGSGINPRVRKVPRAQLDRIFPYVREQRALNPVFQVNTNACGINRAALPFYNGNGAPARLDFSPVGSVDNPPPPPPDGGGGPPTGGGGNGCGNCGNGVGNGGGNGTGNEGNGNGNGNGGSAGNSGNSAGHDSGGPGNSENSPGHKS